MPLVPLYVFFNNFNSLPFRSIVIAREKSWEIATHPVLHARLYSRHIFFSARLDSAQPANDIRHLRPTAHCF